MFYKLGIEPKMQDLPTGSRDSAAQCITTESAVELYRHAQTAYCHSPNFDSCRRNTVDVEIWNIDLETLLLQIVVRNSLEVLPVDMWSTPTTQKRPLDLNEIMRERSWRASRGSLEPHLEFVTLALRLPTVLSARKRCVKDTEVL